MSHRSRPRHWSDVVDSFFEQTPRDQVLVVGAIVAEWLWRHRRLAVLVLAATGAGIVWHVVASR